MFLLVDVDGDGGGDRVLGVFQGPISQGSGVNETLTLGLKVF